MKTEKITLVLFYNTQTKKHVSFFTRTPEEAIQELKQIADYPTFQRINEDSEIVNIFTMKASDFE